MMAGLSHCLIFMEKPDWNPVALLPAELFPNPQPPADTRNKVWMAKGSPIQEGMGVSLMGGNSSQLVKSIIFLQVVGSKLPSFINPSAPKRTSNCWILPGDKYPDPSLPSFSSTAILTQGPVLCTSAPR